jgi:universal stress protein A
MNTQPLGSAATATWKLNRILVPTDFSGVARQALNYAVPLAVSFGAKITLIHVVEPVYVANEPGYPYPAVDLEELMKVAADRLQSLATELIPGPLLDITVVRSGSAFHEITTAAGEMKADLLVITTHGRTGLTHVLMGSTAERIVQHAPCPVLTVRRT